MSSTPCQPTNAPTIAIILMSPPPIASCLNIQLPAIATSQSRPNPTAAPMSAVHERLTARGQARAAIPEHEPADGELVGDDVGAGIGHGDAEQDGGERPPP